MNDTRMIPICMTPSYNLHSRTMDKLALALRNRILDQTSATY